MFPGSKTSQECGHKTRPKKQTRQERVSLLYSLHLPSISKIPRGVCFCCPEWSFFLVCLCVSFQSHVWLFLGFVGFAVLRFVLGSLVLRFRVCHRFPCLVVSGFDVDSQTVSGFVVGLVLGFGGSPSVCLCLVFFPSPFVNLRFPFLAVSLCLSPAEKSTL